MTRLRVKRADLACHRVGRISGEFGQPVKADMEGLLSFQVRTVSSASSEVHKEPEAVIGDIDSFGLDWYWEGGIGVGHGSLEISCIGKGRGIGDHLKLTCCRPTGGQLLGAAIGPACALCRTFGNGRFRCKDSR